jgi:hypothetical protein
VRPDGAGADVEVEDDDVLEELEEDDAVLVAAGGWSEVPHAVRVATRASPTAYEVGRAHVILVTIRSLKGEF